MPTDDLFNLTVSRKQLEAINASLDVFTRVCLAQFAYAIEVSDTHSKKVWDFDETTRHEYRYLCDRLHIILTDMPPNAGHGIGSDKIDPRSLNAYDLHQVTRNFFYEEKENKQAHSVDSSVCVLGNEPKMTIKRVDPAVTHHIECQEYHYTCGDGCCDEYWFEMKIDGKIVEMELEGYTVPKRFGEIPYNLDEILEAVTGLKYTVDFIACD